MIFTKSDKVLVAKWPSVQFACLIRINVNILNISKENKWLIICYHETEGLYVHYSELYENEWRADVNTFKGVKKSISIWSFLCEQGI